MITLGGLIKKIRVNKGIGLREFATKVQVDPGNWSRFETEQGPLYAPMSDVLRVLGIGSANGEYHRLMRLYIYEYSCESGQSYIREYMPEWLEG